MEYLQLEADKINAEEQSVEDVATVEETVTEEVEADGEYMSYFPQYLCSFGRTFHQ
jgi:hypothetical protein